MPPYDLFEEGGRNILQFMRFVHHHRSESTDTSAVSEPQGMIHHDNVRPLRLRVHDRAKATSVWTAPIFNPALRRCFDLVPPGFKRWKSVDQNARPLVQ